MTGSSRSPGTLIQGFSRWSALVSRASLAAGLLILGILVVVTLLAVFYRYLLSAPIPWAEELARYLLIWMTLVGASVTVRERKEIRLDSLVRRLPFKVRLAVETLLLLVVVILLGVILGLSVEMLLLRSGRIVSSSLQVPMTWAHLALPVGFALILFQSIYILLEDMNRLFGRFGDGKNDERSEPSY